MKETLDFVNTASPSELSDWLERAPYNIKDDKSVILAAVKKNGMMLRFASDRLRDDREVVKAAAKRDERALQYASYELQNDNAILIAAIGYDRLRTRPSYNNNNAETEAQRNARREAEREARELRQQWEEAER